MEFLLRKFIKNCEQTENPKVRQRYGEFSGKVGIAANLLLFGVKLFLGLFTGAISILSDAIHNLSDAGASVVTLLGFRLAAKPADREHPFGHGRVEYLTGLFIAAVILIVGVELLQTSVGKIFHPDVLSIDFPAMLVLILTIFMQLALGRFNREIGRRIDSAAILAAAADSLNDCLATFVVLLSLGLHYFLGINVDGWAGVLVAGFILHSGWEAAKDTIQPLLGRAPSRDFVKAIEKAVLANPPVCGVHDLLIHDYGPGRVFISLHAEIPADMDIMKAHECMDALELRLKKQFQVEVTVHMDPIVVRDPEIAALRQMVKEVVSAVDHRLSMHDFRMTTTYHEGRNLIFDVVVPNDCEQEESKLRKKIREAIFAKNPEYHAVIRIDHQYF